MSSPKPSAGLEESATQSPKPESPKHDSASEQAEQNSGRESGEASESPSDSNAVDEKSAPPLPNEPTPDGPPLPSEPLPSGPPLPNEPAPQQEDDGWDCQWDPATQAWFFINRFTGKSQWDNPRVATSAAAPVHAVVPAAPGTQPGAPQPPVSEKPAAGGYNPAIHGDYDPNAWYAQGGVEEDQVVTTTAAIGETAEIYGATATFNRFTGQFQTAGQGPERHSDEAKSKRQMNAFFDVEAAANAHDGRSLKAERSGKKPSKTELKQFKEKRRARKEEKRRAWLRD
ncbi:WW domain-containing protein [Fusarium heterosporum]|uniref:WW domain-containing protein n=1 Tax=Fusarium heterosporum TaxID=42747 RepID=A0A8H5THF4_FUSHE|nr:WW domain-containing protein [Fusarium heterosporum]